MTNPTRRAVLAGLAAAPLLPMTASAGGHLKYPVDMAAMAFAPQILNMTKGDYVVFSNSDRAQHTATARDGSFDTGRLKQGQSAEIRMTQAGSFDYVCEFHPSMVGRIVVS